VDEIFIIFTITVFIVLAAKEAAHQNRKYLTPGVQYQHYFISFFLFLYDIQHCFICRPSDSTVLGDAGIEPRTVATTALAVRRSNHVARSHPLLG
jgi:hypothetical protein